MIKGGQRPRSSAYRYNARGNFLAQREGDTFSNILGASSKTRSDSRGVRTIGYQDRTLNGIGAMQNLSRYLLNIFRTKMVSNLLEE